MTAPYYADDLVGLYLGDCLDLVDVWTTADVLVTDPPYGIAYRSGGMGGIVRSRVHGDADTAARDTALDLWGDRPALDLWGDRPAVVFGSWRQPRPARTTHRLIGHKAKSAPGHRPGAWYPAEEEIYLLGTGWQGKPTQNVLVTREQRSNPYGLVAQTGHPTPKPVELMSRLIEKCPAGTIADPFAGSGATLVAARNLGRRAIGVEIDEGYCETTARRLQQQAFVFEIETVEQPLDLVQELDA